MSITATLCAVLAVASSGLAGAQTLTGTLDSTLTLTSACAVSGSTLTSGLSFGTLAFGSKPATFIGTVTATAAGGSGGVGPTQIVCSPDITSVTIAIDGGDHAGQGTSIGTGARALAASTKYMPYDVFSDSGRTQAYPIGTGVPVTISSPGTPFLVPIYGLINKTSTTAVTPGSYTDALQVQISW